MGIALWIAAGCAAFAATRVVSIGRTAWPRELAASLAAALASGGAATALDFGGGNEPDWRAGLFAVLGALTAIAVVRLVSLTRGAVSDPAQDGHPKR